MSELSRMQRHQSRNKGRKNKTSAQSNKRVKTHFEQTDDLWSRPQSSISESSEESERRGGASAGGLSRSRPSRSGAGHVEEEEMLAPKRTNTYSSYRVRMSKWFVNSLIVIFILLMVGLLWWGLIGAPPLRELF